MQRRPLTPTSFVDNNQIVEGRGAVKLGPVLVLESPAPILRPPSPKMPDEVGVVISQVNMAFSRRKLLSRLRPSMPKSASYDLAGQAASIVTTDRPKKKGTGTKAGPPKARLSLS